MVMLTPGAAVQSRVLVVDDDRLVLANLAEGLEQAGFAVSKATTGEEAIRVCGEKAPDLVIMDVRLPGLSGIEAARKIRETSETPVFFLSAFDEENVVKQAVAEGGLGYLVKPVRLNQLLTSIKAALARAADLKALKTTEENLRIALRGDRHISVAVGVLMERHRLLAAEAFEFLRKRARSRRQNVSETADELIAAVETVNRREH